MKDNSLGKYKSAKFGEGFSKETARVRYETLKSEKSQETIVLRESLVDIKIKMAMAEGQFDNLPGTGKPLDLSHYHDLPEHLRTAYQLLKNSGFVPEEVRLKKEMETLKEKLGNCSDVDEKQKLMAQLTEVSQQYHFHMEYNKGFKKTFY